MISGHGSRTLTSLYASMLFFPAFFGQSAQKPPVLAGSTKRARIADEVYGLFLHETPPAVRAIHEIDGAGSESHEAETRTLEEVVERYNGAYRRHFIQYLDEVLQHAREVLLVRGIADHERDAAMAEFRRVTQSQLDSLVTSRDGIVRGRGFESWTGDDSLEKGTAGRRSDVTSMFDALVRSAAPAVLASPPPAAVASATKKTGSEKSWGREAFFVVFTAIVGLGAAWFQKTRIDAAERRDVARTALTDTIRASMAPYSALIQRQVDYYRRQDGASRVSTAEIQLAANAIDVLYLQTSDRFSDSFTNEFWKQYTDLVFQGINPSKGQLIRLGQSVPGSAEGRALADSVLKVRWGINGLVGFSRNKAFHRP